MKIPFTVNNVVHYLDLPTDLPHRKIGHPFGYILEHPDMAQGYVNIIYDMCRKLPKEQDVTDLMGGIGIYPTVLWDLLQPKSWTSVEIDPECRQYYQQPKAKFHCANAYDYQDFGDIVFIDMPNGTLRTIADNMDGRRRMWNNIGIERPKHLIVTDHGYYWVHLPNHHPWYIEHFGEKPTKDNYARLWDQWMREYVGYTVTEERHGFSSQYFRMEPV